MKYSETGVLQIFHQHFFFPLEMRRKLKLSNY